MMKKKWVMKYPKQAIVDKLHSELKIHPALCNLLALRNIEDFQQAKQFFRTSADHLHDPFLMKDMQKAVERIEKAIQEEEGILIYGDYDVDGTTSVATVFKFFQPLCKHLAYYIPHRFTEGYGVSKKGIEYAMERNIKLIITLDCGIKSWEPIAYAKEHGIDTIVCDHHLPDSILPNAIAILNPKQMDCPYPYKELCGCGVAYKLISAFAKYTGKNVKNVDYFLDLVATAIAADIVPITGENRTLCILGLEKANHQPSIPLQALKTINHLDKPFNINDLVFIIAPRVNAAGRMDDARKAVELFLSNDFDSAKALANLLQIDNNDRRDIDKQTTFEALEQLKENDIHKHLKTTVVYKEDWHKGVVGIVASRLIEHHYRPTIVLTKSGGKITGSARSIKGFNLFEGLNLCAEYLENWGGHYFAAGLTLDEKNLLPFQDKFDEVVSNMVPEEMFQPIIEIDSEIAFTDIQENFIRILNQFAPHGPDNMKPIFLARNVTNYQKLSSIVKEKHLRLVMTQDGKTIMNGIAFNLADQFPYLLAKDNFDILFHIEVNSWNGTNSIQLKVIDIQ
jgi:single-stranded-DNA-specific exonuclease